MIGKLREVFEGDHDWLVSLHNDPLVLYNLTDPRFITIENHMNWWRNLNNEKEKRKIFCNDLDRIGFCKFISIDWNNHNCMLGADIHKDYRGKGYAIFMWQLMIDYAFDVLKMHRVGLTTAEYNKVGQRVYQKLGFKVEGRLIQSLCRDGKFYDQICMCLFREDWK